MLKNIKPLYFFISFAIGLFLVYIFHPAPTVVLKFPSPYNAGNITYKDQDNSCYQYKYKKVECDEHAKPQPLADII